MQPADGREAAADAEAARARSRLDARRRARRRRSTRSTSAPPQVVPKHEPAFVRFDAVARRRALLAAERQEGAVHAAQTRRCSSAARTPTRSTATSRCAATSSSGKHKAVRLVFKTGGNEYWGIEETDWDDAPVLADRSFRHDLGGREFDLYYSGSQLHMVVLQRARRDATGSSTRCSTRCRTRRCWRSPRVSNR